MTKRLAITTVAAMVFAGIAHADDAPKFGYSIAITGTSDYIFRGISYNDQSPAFQPFVELTYGIAYLDFWGSNIAGDYAPYEFDMYAGIRPVTGPINWDLGILYYEFPGAAHSGSLDYVEFKIAASTTPITNLTLGLAGYWTPDQSPAVIETETIEGNASYTFEPVGIFTPTLSGVLGYTRADEKTSAFFDRQNYTYWNAGVKLAVDKYFMDFRYWDTNIKDELADSRFVFSAGVNLP